MIRTRGFAWVLLALLLATLGGCASSSGTKDIAADAVPISVRVVPSTDSSTPLVSIETDLSADVASTWTLWYFYEVRDPAGSGANYSLDADDYLILDSAARVQYVPSGKGTWTISVLLQKTRAVKVEVFVTVIAADSTGKRGAVGSAEVPATSTE